MFAWFSFGVLLILLCFVIGWFGWCLVLGFCVCLFWVLTLLVRLVCIGLLWEFCFVILGCTLYLAFV